MADVALSFQSPGPPTATAGARMPAEREIGVELESANGRQGPDLFRYGAIDFPPRELAVEFEAPEIHLRFLGHFLSDEPDVPAAVGTAGRQENKVTVGQHPPKASANLAPIAPSLGLPRLRVDAPPATPKSPEPAPMPPAALRPRIVDQPVVRSVRLLDPIRPPETPVHPAASPAGRPAEEAKSAAPAPGPEAQPKPLRDVRGASPAGASPAPLEPLPTLPKASAAAPVAVLPDSGRTTEASLPEADCPAPLLAVETTRSPVLKIALILAIMLTGGLSVYFFAGRGPAPQPEAYDTASFTLGSGGWSTDTAMDEEGARVLRQLSYLRQSLPLSDYRVEFSGLIEKRALGWTFRMSDMNNYYGMKISVAGGRPVLVRYAVTGGRESNRAEIPLAVPVRLGSPVSVKLDVKGPRFSLTVQDQPADVWTDNQLKKGGFAFANERDERARITSVQFSVLRGSAR